MPKYRCKKCKAVFYGWGEGNICPQCGGKLEPIAEYTLLKNRPGPPLGESIRRRGSRTS